MIYRDLQIINTTYHWTIIADVTVSIMWIHLHSVNRNRFPVFDTNFGELSWRSAVHYAQRCTTPKNQNQKPVIPTYTVGRGNEQQTITNKSNSINQSTNNRDTPQTTTTQRNETSDEQRTRARIDTHEIYTAHYYVVSCTKVNEPLRAADSMQATRSFDYPHHSSARPISESAGRGTGIKRAWPGYV